jgi:hypothetical protein
MIGASLSRWTMSYFAAALFALVAAEAMMAAGYGFPRATLEAPQTLILVHVVAIGWLSLLMCGALLQFLPVLLARPLYSDILPLPALLSFLAGLAALILGFLQFAGQIKPALPFLSLGGLLLGLGFILTLWNLVRTLTAAQTIQLPAQFVIVGLASVTIAAALGIVFALVLGGVTAYEPFVNLTGAGLPLHIIAGLGGWLTLTAIGVSYRLLSMFMLAPELNGGSTKTALYLGTAALAIAVVGGTAAVLLDEKQAFTFVLLAATAIGVPSLALYATDVLYLYRARKRPLIELNSRMAACALVSLAAVTLLIVILLVLRQLNEHIGAIVFLAAFGWLSGLGLSQLYKIVAFLTWLECYGPVLGKSQTPRVQDLVVEARASRWFLLYFLGVWTGTAALLVGSPMSFQASAVAMLVATAAIITQFVRTRRLADVDDTLRLPLDVQPPRLFVSLSQ